MSNVTSQAMQSAIAAISQQSSLIAAAHLGAQLQSIRTSYAPNIIAAVRSDRASNQPVSGGNDRTGGSSSQRPQNSDEQEDNPRS
ncbi:hypothetical protein FGB62_315g015 [Gracilaria domingensis]|nr:hypothetical protein FGB62_315g015 [Gracilaria domingensis]